MTGSSRNMQDEVSTNKERCIIDTTYSDILSREVSCMPALSKNMSQDNQAGKVDASLNLCRMRSMEKKHAF